MRAKAITFVTLVILLMLCATPAYSQELPPLPHAFYGTVEINDSPAPVGTQVEARGGGVLTGIEGNPVVTTAAGSYGSPDPMGPKLIVQGDMLDGAAITFYVNGVSTEQTTEWHKLVAFNAIAERAKEELSRGLSLKVEGELRSNRWLDKSNYEHTRQEIIVHDFELAGRREEDHSPTHTMLSRKERNLKGVEGLKKIVEEEKLSPSNFNKSFSPLHLDDEEGMTN